jgi:hypothetical protein
MAAPKGTVPPNAGKGRKPGSRNKVGADIRAMVHTALVKAGGVKYLQTQAEENPSAFLALVGKTLPKDVNLSADGGLSLSITLSK